MVNRGTEKKGGGGGEGKKKGGRENQWLWGSNLCPQFTHQRASLLNHCNKVATQLSYFDVFWVFFSESSAAPRRVSIALGTTGTKLLPLYGV